MKRRAALALLSALAIVGSTFACSLADLVGPFSPSAMPASPSPVAVTPTALPACQNSLYPVSVGATWTYSVSGVTTDKLTRSIIAVRPDGFTDQDMIANRTTRTSEWKCSGGALIALSPEAGPGASVEVDQGISTLQASGITGVTIPAAVLPGDSWTQDFTLQGERKSALGKQESVNAEVNLSCRSADVERLSVPAGTYDALRVGCSIDSTVTVLLAGAPSPSTISSVATMWFATGVGLVKLEGQVGSLGHTSMELTATSLQP